MYENTKPIGTVADIRLDRAIVVAAIVLLVVGSAAYTIAGIGMKSSALEMTFMGSMEGMGAMKEMSMGADGGGTAGEWSPEKVVLIFLMWWIMMIAMMLPSAAPTILLYTALLKRFSPESATSFPTIVFVAGYLLVWAGFSLAATGAQWELEAAGIVMPSMMMIDRDVIAALLVMAAGAYQFLPLKTMCLIHCRKPAEFIAHHHRPGALGAARLGIFHGAFCLGCCFALMALLFVGGIMNLFWIFGLAALLAFEKLAPHGPLFSRLAGGGLILSGMLYLAAAV